MVLFCVCALQFAHSGCSFGNKPLQAWKLGTQGQTGRYVNSREGPVQTCTKYAWVCLHRRCSFYSAWPAVLGQVRPLPGEIGKVRQTGDAQLKVRQKTHMGVPHIVEIAFALQNPCSSLEAAQLKHRSRHKPRAPHGQHAAVDGHQSPDPCP
jgi:hypothetical protein